MRNMTEPDNRLKACAELITGDYVCDIGTDHGYLPAYLLTSGRCTRAIAADINEMPLDAARRTLMQAGVLDRAQLILSDGTKNIDLAGVTDVVLAGMGGELIADIVTGDERLRSVNIVTQPMTRTVHLRKSMRERGFGISYEMAVRSKGRLYTVIAFKYTGECVDDEIMCHIGGLSSLWENDREYMINYLSNMREIAANIELSDPHRASEMRELADRIVRKFF